MSGDVLGRDPFARGRPAASEPDSAAGRQPRKRSSGARRKGSKPAKRSHPAQPAADYGQARAVAAEIDRQELLGAIEPTHSPLLKLLYQLTRVLRPSTYGERLGRMGMYFHAEEVGPFGFDPVFWQRVKPFFQLLYDRYWRVELEGGENLPAEGRALLVANHSGSLPWDGIMLRLAIENATTAGRQVHFLVEDFVFHFPFLGPFVNKVGGVRACQDNASRLLAAGELVGVFPEGIKGIGKLYRDRYRLQRFGRGGFAKLALRSDSPVLPVAVVGAEEIHPMLSRLTWLARSLGLPYLPLTPTFPWLGPLGLVPLPSKWHIRIGEPIHFDPADPDAPETEARLMDKVELVRGRIQQMVDELVEQRGHPFWGDRRA